MRQVHKFYRNVQCLDPPDALATPDMLVMILYEWLTGRGKKMRDAFYRDLDKRSVRGCPEQLKDCETVFAGWKRNEAS